MHHGNVTRTIARGLKEIQARIHAAEIPSSRIDETLNIATWNIREFGKTARSEAAIHYIAEILNQFDVVSLVELRDDLTDLGRVMQILGSYWRVVYSDALPDGGGNHERIAFLYDKRVAVFQGLATKASPPRNKNGEEYLPEISWWRSPYLAAFRAGSFDFVILAVHIRWGDSVKARAQEIQTIADWIDGKRKEQTCEDQDFLVMGDFNIESTNGATYKALLSRGLVIPEALIQNDPGSNLDKNKRYDQILHYPQFPKNFINCGGVFDFYAGGISPLFKGLTKPQFTFQLSDHFPLWIQINTDISGQTLEQIIQG
jgi:endonuclease/exonuclease/phosphatase family metal-dependent hydrolase